MAVRRRERGAVLRRARARPRRPGSLGARPARLPPPTARSGVRRRASRAPPRASMHTLLPLVRARARAAHALCAISVCLLVRLPPHTCTRASGGRACALLSVSSRSVVPVSHRVGRRWSPPPSLSPPPPRAGRTCAHSLSRSPRSSPDLSRARVCHRRRRLSPLLAASSAALALLSVIVLLARAQAPTAVCRSPRPRLDRVAARTRARASPRRALNSVHATTSARFLLLLSSHTFVF